MESEIIVDENDVDDMVKSLSNEQCVHGKNKYGRPWSKKDDSRLMFLVGKYGKSWDLILPEFVNRNKEHVVNRWIRLHTEEIRKSEWTPEEDAKLKHLVDKYGKKWTSFSKYLPGRSGIKCRQRWALLSKIYSNPVEETPSLACETPKKIESASSDSLFNCSDCPCTPLSFKKALAKFGIKCDGKREAPSSPGFIGDLAEIINQELNLDDSEKLGEKLITTKTYQSPPDRACNKSLVNLCTDTSNIKMVDPKQEKKVASRKKLDFLNEMNDESTKEN